MFPISIELESLTREVQQGDVAAKAKLGEHVGASMERIVRRVLEKGTAATVLERRILAAAQHLFEGARLNGSGARVGPVARVLCHLVVKRLWPGQTEGPCQPTTRI